MTTVQRIVHDKGVREGKEVQRIKSTEHSIMAPGTEADAMAKILKGIEK